jgi:hypothetical protein
MGHNGLRFIVVHKEEGEEQHDEKSLPSALLTSLAYRVVVAGETITAQEVEGYFYADGEMKRSKGQFEITYYLEGNTITRTRVYDFSKKEVIPDDTVYQIQRQLLSDGSKGFSLGKKPVTRAVGQPGLDAVDLTNRFVPAKQLAPMN